MMIPEMGPALAETTAPDRTPGELAKTPDKESIPWTEAGAWRAIQERICRAARSGNRKMEAVRRMAVHVAAQTAAVHRVMDALAADTCPWCPAPCCLSAKVWFDLRDLLLIHFTGGTPPPAQAISSWRGRCRYIGPRGCRLARPVRPWICTWYLCPTQKDRIRNRDPKEWQIIAARLRGIADARRQIQADFLKAVGTPVFGLMRPALPDRPPDIRHRGPAPHIDGGRTHWVRSQNTAS